MAVRHAIGTGLWSAAGTWGKTSNTPTLHATTNISCTLATSFYSAVFTAPSLVNACQGVWIFNVSGGTTGTITIALQEYSGVSWSDKVSLVRTNNVGHTANHWYYYKFASPYTYATLTAGYYRVRINCSTTQNIAADGAGTAIAYMAVDDQTGVPAATDDLFIGGGSSLVTVTMDGTQSIGSGTLTGLPTSYRSLGFAILIAENGLINYDISANSQLTCKGSIATQATKNTAFLASGAYQIGTAGTPIPSAYTAKHLFDENSVNINYGFYCLESITVGGIISVNGASLTFYKTTLSSGIGTTGSPLIVADAVDWSVNDEIWVASTSLYNDGEKKFIKVKNSSTSYTLSDTAGGVEAGLVNSHAVGAKIFNTQRNAKISSTSASYGWFANFGSNVALYQNFQWMKFEYYGGSSTALCLILSNNNSGTLTLNYNVFSPVALAAAAYSVMTASNIMETYTGNIWVGSNTTTAGANGMFRIGTIKNKTFTDNFILNSFNAGLEIAGTINCIFNNFQIIGSCGSNNAGIGGFLMSSMFNSTFNNCAAQASRRYGVFYAGNSVNVKWNSLLAGSVGVNVVGDVGYLTSVPDYFITNYFNTCTYGTSVAPTGYLSMASGSGIFISQPNGSSNRYEAYFSTGSWQSTGAGLADTNVKTASSLAIRLSPEDSTNGLVYEFYILARAGKAVSVIGYLQKNATFATDVLKVELFLPGSIVANVSQTMPSDTNWNLFSLAGTYSGSIDTFAKIRISAISATAGAYAYLDDLYNGTNKITAIDTWLDGAPSNIMYEQVGDAAAIWAVPTSGNAVAGSFGEKVGNKLLTLAKFLGLK